MPIQRLNAAPWYLTVLMLTASFTIGCESSDQPAMPKSAEPSPADAANESDMVVEDDFHLLRTDSGDELTPSPSEVASTASESDAIVREVLKVWRDRQTATRHLSFSWTSADYDRYSITMEEKARPQIAEVNATTTEKGRIAYGDGDQIRLDVTLSGNVEVFEVFAEGVLTVFSPQSQLGNPHAGIGRGTEPTAWRYYPGTPMRLCFRPFLATAGFRGLENAQCVARGVLFRGESCDELTWRHHEVLVSTDEERLPLRYRCRRLPDMAQIFSETAIEYDRETPDGSVPVRWEITKYGIDGETVIKSSLVTLDEYEFDEPVPQETFYFSFPAGTWVNDNINNETYIVREGKPNRVVRPGEYTGDNYQQLLNSEPPVDDVGN